MRLRNIPSRLRALGAQGPAMSTAKVPAVRYTRPEPPECPPGWTIGPPDFVIFGAAKAGTTRWRRLLGLHPNVLVAPREIHYWDDFADHWPDASDLATYYRHFPRPEGVLTGDKTPQYLSLYWAAGMLREAAPSARIIVILRDPIARFTSSRTFDDRLRGPKLKAGMSDASFTRSVVDRSFRGGLYAQQMTWLFESFPREQVLVLQFEACITDAPEQLRRTQRFLGLTEVTPPQSAFDEWINTVGGPKITTEPERKALMRGLFEEDVLTLRGLVPDLDLSLWPNFADLAEADGVVASVGRGST
jgi:Sulfotransferase domain